MPTFAAIDIGSNSCRLAIAVQERHKLKVLHEDREVTRLGESVFETGVISPEAMAQTDGKALKRFHKAVRRRTWWTKCASWRRARCAMRVTPMLFKCVGEVDDGVGPVEVISGLEEGTADSPGCD